MHKNIIRSSSNQFCKIYSKTVELFTKRPGVRAFVLETKQLFLPTYQLTIRRNKMKDIKYIHPKYSLASYYMYRLSTWVEGLCILYNIHLYIISMLTTAVTHTSKFSNIIFSGRNNFHCGGIEKVANIVQLLITTFNFIQEEHRMAR